MKTFKAKEIHGGFYYQVQKIIKRKSSKYSLDRGLLQRGSKIPGNFFNLHKKISLGVSVFHIFNDLL